ncbi:Glycine/D-amino acid oxidase [Herbiconiux ginsengi]|uniref:Glycine/D-amino acid oxidase n=2 Tax=Herbiconiux ginsengi TaxID=381665 RepID=A0A1H3L981_9MICO|nr:Glycine/D-amino acid oxidase [Herbiconiux ginsengi]
MQSLWLDGRRPIPTHPFMADEEYDDVVVGAGITGLSTALMLAEAGRHVVVLEAREIGALATGNTTGKISLLQGSRLSTIRAHHSRRIVQAYVDSNRDGQEWLLDFCERAGAPVQRRTAYSYAQHRAGAADVEAEYRAAREAGLPVSLVERADVPFPFAFGVALAEQAQFDPMDALDALARELIAAGGTIHTRVRVTGVRASSPALVTTSAGEVRGRTVVLATATPILDRGLYFAKTHGQRSYGMALELRDAGPGDLPEGMFLSIGDSSHSRSVRTAPRDGHDLLVIGGNGHEVGRPGAESEAELVDDLRDWGQTFFPGARMTHAWSAQDYESHNLIPFVGALPRGRGRIYLATGYAKWGMTNAVAAGIRICAEIFGDPWRERRHWHQVLGSRATRPADLARGARAGVQVGAAALSGWLGAEGESTPIARPGEGEGVVANAKGRPVGISTVDGTTCAVSAVCTHLGGVLHWNDAERSWDCPLHASRFAADGTRLEGPALADLERMPRRTHPPRIAGT